MLVLKRFFGTAAVISCLPFTVFLMPAQTPHLEPHDRLNEQWWKNRHEAAVRMTEYGRADVAFLGDSITQGWNESGDEVWDRQIAPLKAANFGFSGDRTDHVLWRLQNGELIGMHPKLVVLMIGTNNIGQGGTPEQTAEGVRAVVKYLNDHLPKTRVLLLGIFPRAESPDDPYRQRVALATDQFKSIADGRRDVFLDIGSSFLDSKGTLSPDIFPDALHPNEKGYQIWASAVTPSIKEMLGRR